MDTDQRPKKRRRLLWSCLAALFVGCILYGYAIGWDAWGRVNRNLAKAQKSGFPLEAKDVFIYHRVAPEDNAAGYYPAIHDAHNDGHPPPDGDSFFRYVRGETGFDLSQVAAYIKHYQKEIDAAVQAAEEPALFLDKDWTRPEDVMLPELAVTKHASQLLLARAILRASSNDVNGAVSDLERALVLAKQLDSSGIGIAHMVANSIRRLAFGAFQMVLSDSHMDQQGVRRLLALLDHWPQQCDLTTPLRLSAYESVWRCRNFGKLPHDDYLAAWDIRDGLPGSGEEWARLAWNAPGVQAEATQIMLDYWREALATYDRDEADLRDWAGAMERNVPGATGFSGAASELARQLLAYQSELPLGCQESVARRRVLEAGIRIVLDGGRQQGKLPDDPFAEGPLVFDDSGAGFVVYSVGRDGNDNSGATHRLPSSGEVDVVFRYPFERRAR